MKEKSLVKVSVCLIWDDNIYENFHRFEDEGKMILVKKLTKNLKTLDYQNLTDGGENIKLILTASNLAGKNI